MDVAQRQQREQRMYQIISLYPKQVAAICFGLVVSSAIAQSEPTSGSHIPRVKLMEMVEKKARNLSKQDFQSPHDAIPEALKKLNYDQYRAIRFKPKQALWRDDGLFEVQLFPPGFIYKETVGLKVIDRQQVSRRVPFNAKYYTYNDTATRKIAEKAQSNIGYSGFRIHFPLNSADYKDEIAVFQGASYFRLVGAGQVYGLSARGLAINTAESDGEEFPRFTDFWLVKPSPDSDQLTLFALLDSPSVTGAYRIRLTASSSTVAEIDAVLFPREDIKKTGIAPLTSMFLFGDARLRHQDDIRHEVHDSDGLLVHTSDNKWIWRPLSNPKSLRVTSMVGSMPRGFGLLQRDREFDHYLDAEAHYEKRPGLWVEPRGQWGEGRVELVEIPSNKETNDNIVAYWVPKQGLRAGKEYRFSYTMSTSSAITRREPLAKVDRTLIGWGATPGEPEPASRSVRQFAVDFTGGAAAELPSDVPVQVSLNTSSGRLSDITVKPLPGNRGWRAAFRLHPKEEKPADLNLHLHLRGKRISEEWSYVWDPTIINQ